MVIRTALAQAPSEVGNVDENWKSAKTYIERAGQADAQLIVFPELFLQGYLANEAFADTAVVLPGPLQDELSQLAQRYRLSVVMGLARADPGFPHLVYNSALLANPDGTTFIYDKIHLGTYGAYVEGCFFAPGKAITTTQAPFGPIGIEICSDIAFPEVARVLALQGATLHIVLSAGPDEFKDTWPCLLKVRSLENAFFTIYVNTVGEQRGINFFGGSRIVSPAGHTIAEAPLNEPYLLVEDIDLDEVARQRRHRLLFRDRFPDLYQTILEGPSTRTATGSGRRSPYSKPDGWRPNE